MGGDIYFQKEAYIGIYFYVLFFACWCILHHCYTNNKSGLV